MTSRTILLAAVLLSLASILPGVAGAQGLPPPPPPPIPPSASPTPGAAPASPEPAESPSALPSAVPSPGPSLQPAPIRVDRARVGIVPGATAVVHVTGGAGPLVASPSFAGVDVVSDSSGRTLTLTGVANGRGTVTLSDAAGDTAAVTVLVAPRAGVVPGDATVDLAGTVSPQFVTARVQDAIAQSAQMQPGTTLAVNGLTTGTLHPGDVLEAQARVVVQGNDTYVDQSGVTNVHLRVAALPRLDPAVLFYSDDPERLGALDDGVLFRGTIDQAQSARAYVYHVSDVPRRLFLALATTAGTAHVQVLGAAAGPTDAFSYVGHVSTLRYLLERAPQESVVTTVSSAAPAIVPLGAGPMLAGQLIAAIYDLRVLDGGPVNVMVVAAGIGVDPATLLAQPEHPSDGHFRRGEFSLANVPPLAISYTAGSPDPAPFTVGMRYFADGRAAFPNARPDIVAAAGQRAPLAGDYGVLRNVALQLANPTTVPQNVYLYEQPGANGGVTTTIWFDGDAAPTEIRCVSDPSQRYLVKGFGLAPGQTLNVTGTYMTDGASFLPLAFGLTATQPPVAPPNGCGPKPDAPAANTVPSIR
jgi:hypothetical protein